MIMKRLLRIVGKIVGKNTMWQYRQSSYRYPDIANFVSKIMVPKVRVELTRPCGQWFLRPSRLPFRHFGTLLPL